MDKLDEILFTQGPEALMKYMEEQEKNCPHPEDQRMRVFARGATSPHFTCKACWKSWDMSDQEAKQFDQDIRASLTGKGKKAKTK